MKHAIFNRAALVLLFILLPSTQLYSQSDFWVSGYLTSWSLNTGVHESGYGDGNIHKDSIDFDALTHIIMFAISLGSDGTIGYGNLSPGRRGPFNDFVHSKGKPIILSVGGAGNNSFSGAISPATRTTTVRNLLALRRSQRYDGYDIDMEPVNSSDTANLRLFIRELYDSLQRETAFYDVTKHPLLTAAIYNNAGFWGGMAPYLDQINLMSYDFFGTWFGKSWHNNAPFGGPGDVDIYNAVMTTVESKMQRFIDSGIPRSKFGVGVDFNGYVWRGGVRSDGSGNGITAPRQLWSTAPSMVGGKEVTGYTLKKNWIDRYPGSVRYDSVAKVPYLGIDSAGSANDYYVTFQDTSTAREIVELGRAENLGGLIIWELGGGYYSPSDFPGVVDRHPMLKAIKRAMGWTSAVHPPSPPVPSAPGNLATGVGTTTTFQWAPVSGASAYDLQISSSPDFTGIIVDTAGLTLPSVLIPGLAPLTNYHWRVRAVNDVGAGAYSTAFQFQTREPGGALSYSKIVLDFGRIAVGSSGRDSFMVQNVGTQSVSISGIVSSQAAYTATIGDHALNVGESGFIVVTFNPTGRATFSGTLILTHDGLSTPDTVAVTGRGANPPRVRTSASSVDFGHVNPNTEDAETVRVYNMGDFDLVISEITSTNPVFAANALSSTIVAGGNTALIVRAHPTIPRSEQGYILVRSNAGASAESISVTLDASSTSDVTPGTGPHAYGLSQNFPNPFNPNTEISFSLREPGHVRLTVYDGLGREVALLIDEMMESGTQMARWDGRTTSGESVSSGVYYYRVSISPAGMAGPTFVEVRKMVLAR